MTTHNDLGKDTYNTAVSAFKEAIATTAGQTAFAKICGCTQGNISLLVGRNSLLPVRFVLRVEAATGVSRHRLRPDIYPVEISTDRPIGSDGSGVACEVQPVSQGPDAI